MLLCLLNQLLKTIDITRNRDSFAAVVSEIEASINIIGINSDLFFTATENKETFKELERQNKKVSYREIQSIHGHDSFLIEFEQLDHLLNDIF